MSKHVEDFSLVDLIRIHFYINNAIEVTIVIVNIRIYPENRMSQHVNTDVVDMPLIDFMRDVFRTVVTTTMYLN